MHTFYPLHPHPDPVKRVPHHLCVAVSPLTLSRSRSCLSWRPESTTPGAGRVRAAGSSWWESRLCVSQVFSNILQHSGLQGDGASSTPQKLEERGRLTPSDMPLLVRVPCSRSPSPVPQAAVPVPVACRAPWQTFTLLWKLRLGSSGTSRGRGFRGQEFSSGQQVHSCAVVLFF